MNIQVNINYQEVAQESFILGGYDSKGSRNFLDLWKPETKFYDYQEYMTLGGRWNFSRLRKKWRPGTKFSDYREYIILKKTCNFYWIKEKKSFQLLAVKKKKDFLSEKYIYIQKIKLRFWNFCQ